MEDTMTKEIEHSASDESYFGQLYTCIASIDITMGRFLAPYLIIQLKRHLMLYEMTVKSLFTVAVSGDKIAYELMVNQITELNNHSKELIDSSSSILETVLSTKNKLN